MRAAQQEAGRCSERLFTEEEMWTCYHSEKPRPGLGFRKTEAPVHVAGMLTDSLLWKALWQYLSQLEMCTCFDPEFPLLEIMLSVKATVSPQGLLEENVGLSNVCKSEKRETTQMLYVLCNDLFLY